MSQSDGTTADYYELPEGVTELQDLIMFRDMNGQDAESIRAIYRKGIVNHSSRTRDTKKVVFYQSEELCRLAGISPKDMPKLRNLLREYFDEVKRVSEKSKHDELKAQL